MNTWEEEATWSVDAFDKFPLDTTDTDSNERVKGFDNDETDFWGSNFPQTDVPEQKSGKFFEEFNFEKDDFEQKSGEIYDEYNFGNDILKEKSTEVFEKFNYEEDVIQKSGDFFDEFSFRKDILKQKPVFNDFNFEKDVFEQNEFNFGSDSLEAKPLEFFKSEGNLEFGNELCLTNQSNLCEDDFWTDTDSVQPGNALFEIDDFGVLDKTLMSDDAYSTLTDSYRESKEHRSLEEPCDFGGTRADAQSKAFQKKGT